METRIFVSSQVGGGESVKKRTEKLYFALLSKLFKVEKHVSKSRYAMWKFSFKNVKKNLMKIST